MKDVPKVIDRFDGNYAYLSNFYSLHIPIVYEGIEYPTVEHAFQAAKTFNKTKREEIAAAPTPGQAKALGRKVDLRDDWEEVKDGIMENLIHLKFKDKDLRLRLICTGDATLVEGNTWNDTYWGVCKGVGKNTLGRILMKERDNCAAIGITE